MSEDDNDHDTGASSGSRTTSGRVRRDSPRPTQRTGRYPPQDFGESGDASKERDRQNYLFEVNRLKLVAEMVGGSPQRERALRNALRERRSVKPEGELTKGDYLWLLAYLIVALVLFPLMWWLVSTIVPFLWVTYIDYWNFINYTE